MFDFLNQLGKKAEGKEEQKMGEQKGEREKKQKDEWDLIFNIGNDISPSRPTGGIEFGADSDTRDGSKGATAAVKPLPKPPKAGQ